LSSRTSQHLTKACQRAYKASPINRLIGGFRVALAKNKINKSLVDSLIVYLKGKTEIINQYAGKPNPVANK